ncbi:uncharacterized membrane protein DDB_G0293934-like isoform X1 [Salvia splendens]|uniref:uncharacterized membrane protein DDB_G0293934-like isoform X1 n=2 Tax=Salvia splendens TaxID=180675 RepID=UPI001C263614|nr:uncharacterized membrane protein DDB_G0293934-like isoform X1 [Salvia splendens]XP_042065781.1 uncharacterized membrane protein DDB_G0293934-like isoform X1 [Salvia splendens]XP_042065782.1 uncharacterized membrane protein DDB_G0293934-like isoform X1 [Salvia splendens]XP_042065783.1 uncharacterized membrane protein DDB_G0293934-like isoform X1 [Salvia splendens]XP_042065784.1 uncharacterized membrane protein DDB_G0293934-like isoform X1 [Salvia splendens]XP_042065785.1 uncharacterized memb
MSHSCNWLNISHYSEVGARSSEMERKNSHATNRDGSLSRSAATTSSDFVLQWGNRKRLRCMKVHVKGATTNDPPGSDPSKRVNRRVVRSDLLNNNNNNTTKNPIPNPPTFTNGNLNLRHRPTSPSHRILRNSEREIGMRGNSNGVKGLASPDRGERKGTSTSNNGHSHHHHPNNNKANNSNHNHENNHHSGGGGSGSSENAHDIKKGDGDAAVWPKFVIGLTNKEKEEDFMALKGSKLPQRPKKRAKLIQRTLNLVSPGTWLCDLTFERYEVREKKVSKKKSRGLRAMGNMIESDSE